MIKLLMVVPVLLLSACSVLPEQLPTDFYQLPPPTQELSAQGPLLPALRIGRPVTSEMLSGNRLLVMTTDNQFQLFPNMRLAAPLPLLWRDWLLDAFWRDSRVSGLSAASQGLQSGLELGGTLRAFQVELTESQPQAVIQYDAILISTTGRNIVASRRFEVRHIIETLEAPLEITQVINAMGIAANELASELIEWTIVQGQAITRENSTRGIISTPNENVR